MPQAEPRRPSAEPAPAAGTLRSGLRRPAGRPVERGERLTLWLGLLLPLCFAALCAIQVWELRRDAWQKAERNAQNLLALAGRDIMRQIDLYDRALQGVAANLADRGDSELPRPLPGQLLFAPAAATTHLGSIVVMDAKGEIVASSDPGAGSRRDFSAHHFFLRHAADPAAGLQISHPFPDRYQQDHLIALSRRIPTADGSFAGVVVGTLRLAYLRDLLGGMEIGRASTINLFAADGTLIYRSPAGGAQPGLDLSRAPTVRRTMSTPKGVFIGTAAIDEVQRLYSFTRLGEWPLILNVAVATEEILREWREHATWIGLAVGLLSLIMAALLLRLRQELRLRRAAEALALAEGARLAELSETDALTGLGNRRRLDRLMALEWARLQRQAQPLAMIMLDIDHFKAFNDSQGHPAGDAVLCSLADCIRAAIRPDVDLAARYGGEEFAVLLPEMPMEGALRIAARIQSQLLRLDLPHPAAPGGRVTVSLGVAARIPAPGTAADMLLRAADAALYEAKHRGRDRIASAAEGLVA
ncbi:GGDEF domain-containing protein [Roseomonas sp. USHLN139]|uniref:GGDEF domain-containing protein n=1 Tax=Roseomonas sp. USHLN139 TaxID=3081298 RepID=UPI003B0248CF